MNSKVTIVSCTNYNQETVRESISKALNLLGGLEQFVKPEQRILIKPNLCLPASVNDALTTHPEVIKCTIDLCRSFTNKITVGDNPIVGHSKSLFGDEHKTNEMENILAGFDCGYSKFNGDKVEFSTSVNNEDYTFYIAKEIFENDVIINMPKLKTHSLMTLTGAVKNMYGIVPGGLKKKLHGLLPQAEEFAEILVEIYSKAIPTLHIMDAVIGIEGDGPGIQGEKTFVGLILASNDGVALDAVAATLIGLKPDNILTTKIAKQRKIGESDLNKIELLGEPLEKYIKKDYKLPVTKRYTSSLTKKVFDIAHIGISIDEEKCTSCLQCLENCPVHAISNEDSHPSINANICVSCMTCHELCMQGAIKLTPSKFYQQLSQLKYRNRTQ